MPKFLILCHVDSDADDATLLDAIQTSGAPDAISKALQADVRLSITSVLCEVIDALYADVDTGELTGRNTIAANSAADFVDEVSQIVAAHGLTPQSIE